MLKIEELREMIKLIDESSIHEFTYESNGEKIVLKKPDHHQVESISKMDHANVTQKNEVPKEETIPVKDEKEDQVEALPDESIVDYDYEIVSPMVGTLYRAPSPESDPYVNVGSKVTKDSIVCIVEAMKLFNEIEAEVNGEIVEILVENGELVEYGQPLFRVKTK